jgi:hypothetical protein
MLYVHTQHWKLIQWEILVFRRGPYDDDGPSILSFMDKLIEEHYCQLLLAIVIRTLLLNVLELGFQSVHVHMLNATNFSFALAFFTP